MPHTCGLPLLGDPGAETDAEVVRRLRAAGARIGAVTVADSGGFGVTTPAFEHPFAAGVTVGGYADSC